MSRKARRRSSVGVVLLLLACIPAVLAGCSEDPTKTGTLSYEVEPGQGSLTTTILDDRPGEHTVWLVVKRANGAHLWSMRAVNRGTTGSAGHVSTTGDVARGVYTYRVLEVDGIADDRDVEGDGRSRRQIAAGEVTVP